MDKLLREEAHMLCALGRMGELSVGQLSRFLTEAGAEAGDIRQGLASLKERGLICQAVNLSGIVYRITDAGSERVASDEELSNLSAGLAAVCADLAKTFALEENYLAQYTEQSSGIVPVFLSIRDKDKVVLKISVIVNSVDAAKKIAAAWRKNAGKAYDAVWQAVSEGEPDAGLWTDRPEEELE